MPRFFPPAYGTTLRHDYRLSVQETFGTQRGNECLREVTRRFVSMEGIDALATHTYWSSHSRMPDYQEANRIAVQIAQEELRRSGKDIPLLGAMSVMCVEHADADGPTATARNVDEARGHHF